ncbi:hypothetical protein U1Q18_043858 [Sarracenia purpurea var. burkii]
MVQLYAWQMIILQVANYSESNISKRVFELIKSECSADAWVSAGAEVLGPDASKGQSQNENVCCIGGGCGEKAYGGNPVVLKKSEDIGELVTFVVVKDLHVLLLLCPS